MIWRWAYTAVLWLALPAVLWRLWRRGALEPGYRSAMRERFGFYGGTRVEEGRPIIWLHAVSLGETRASRPLVEALRAQYPSHRWLITHMTATGREAARELFAGQAEFAWLPYDYPFAIRRFLRRFRPSLAILMETEVWFNLVNECAHAGVPLLLANARLSEKSARGYRILGPLSRLAFSALSAVAAQTENDARRLRELGCRSVQVTGNVKFETRPDARQAALGAILRENYAGRSVLLAASTREGEEALIIDAFTQAPIEGTILVIVPRHPQRFAAVESLLGERGLKYAKRSQSLRLAEECLIMLGDSVGEMQAYYSAADVAFIGGSLLPFGGQNLIEACAEGVPVLIGPHTFNFEEAAEAAVSAGAARRVSSASEVVEQARGLVADEATRRAIGEAGKAFCDRHRGAAQRVAAMAGRLIG